MCPAGAAGQRGQDLYRAGGAGGPRLAGGQRHGNQQLPGRGGNYSVPDDAYVATGAWNNDFELEAGVNSVLRVHCNYLQCNRWDSQYNLFDLDSATNQDVLTYFPQSSSAVWQLGGTSYGFSPSAFTAPTINVGTLNATTINGGVAGGAITSGTISAARLPVFGAQWHRARGGRRAGPRSDCGGHTVPARGRDLERTGGRRNGRRSALRVRPVACIVGQYHATGLTGGIGGTAVYTPTAAGQYRICVSATVTAVSSTAASVQPGYSIYPRGGSSSRGFGLPVGVNLNSVIGDQPATTGPAFDCVVADVAANQPIQTQSYFGGTNTGGTYRYDIYVELMGNN